MNHSLHYVEHGAGTPVIFIHGYTVDHQLLLPLEAAFATRPGWRRIYIDLPGHGRSPAGRIPATTDAVAAVVAAAVDQLTDGGHFAVCGNSFGGQIARDLVARYKSRVLGMALLAPVVHPRLQRRRAIHRTFHEPTRSLDLGGADPQLVAEFIDTAVEHTETSWADFNRYVAPGIKSHDRQFALALLSAFDLTSPPEDRPGTFERPSLAIVGRQDNAVGFEDQFDLLNSYPRMTYAALDATGHNVHLDQPELSHALLGTWLNEMAHERTAPSY